MIKLMIVDDHEVVRQGLRLLLQRSEGIEVVAEAGSTRGAIDDVDRLSRETGGPPDVVLMDVRMPGEAGIEACRAIRNKHPRVKVLMLTSYMDAEALYASVMAGASGYILKKVALDDLTRAIRTVYHGGSLLDPSATETLLRNIRSGNWRESPKEPLTKPERHMLTLIARGMTNKEIADLVSMSEKSVRNSVSRILRKLGLSNRTEAAVFAVRHGLAGEWKENDS